MYRRLLFGALLVLVETASADNFRLICGKNFTATQQRRYALEPSVVAGPGQHCCAALRTGNAEGADWLFLLLEIFRLSAAACADEPVLKTEELTLLNDRVLLTKNQLCKEPSFRYIWAIDRATVCFSRSRNESGSDWTAPLFAFSAVAARSICETGNWLNTSASSRRLEYVFAPDEQLSTILPGTAFCNSSEDYLIDIQPENVSASAVRVEALTTPGAGSCRSLYLQGILVADGACFAVAAGSHLTIAYNRSRSAQCATQLSVGFVVHLEYHDDDNLGSAVAHICTADDQSSSNVLIIALCTTALVLLSVSVGIVMSTRRVARCKCQRWQQASEIIDMHDNELYEAAPLKS